MTMDKFLDPKNDFAFKRIFGTEKHKGILIRFLNDMLGFECDEQIAEVQFLKTQLDPETARKKQSIVDVLCKDERGNQYIVEMQVAHTAGFEKRAQFYAARAYSNQMNKSEGYENLKEILFLAITDFVMFPDKPGYKSTHVTLDTEFHTRDLKDFYFTFLELPKFTKRIDELTSLVDKWAYFFKHASHTTPEELEMLTSSDIIFKEAYQALDQCYWNEVELNTYEREMKNIRDSKALLASSFAQGKAEGAKEAAKKMLQSNYPIEEVAKICNLTLDEINALIEEFVPFN